MESSVRLIQNSNRMSQTPICNRMSVKQQTLASWTDPRPLGTTPRTCRILNHGRLSPTHTGALRFQAHSPHNWEGGGYSSGRSMAALGSLDLSDASPMVNGAQLRRFLHQKVRTVIKVTERDQNRGVIGGQMPDGASVTVRESLQRRLVQYGALLVQRACAMSCRGAGNHRWVVYQGGTPTLSRRERARAQASNSSCILFSHSAASSREARAALVSSSPPLLLVQVKPQQGSSYASHYVEVIGVVEDNGCIREVTSTEFGNKFGEHTAHSTGPD